jgi:hypothetical protein
MRLARNWTDVPDNNEEETEVVYETMATFSEALWCLEPYMSVWGEECKPLYLLNTIYCTLITV